MLLPGFDNVYIRVFSVDRERLVQLKEELREKAEILYVVDHREKKREVYAGPINSEYLPAKRKSLNTNGHNEAP